MEIDFQKKPMKLYSTGKQVIASTPTIPSNSRLCNTAENMRGIDQLTESSRNLLYDFKADLRRLDSLIKAHAHQLNPYSIHLSLRPELSIFEETNRIDSLFLRFRQKWAICNDIRKCPDCRYALKTNLSGQSDMCRISPYICIPSDSCFVEIFRLC